MKTTLEKLKAAIRAMDREELETLASNVTVSLYGSVYVPEDDDLTPEQIAEFKLKEGDLYLDSEKEWTGDTVEDVAEDIDNAGLRPDRLPELRSE